MLELWIELPWWLRLIVALGLMIAGGVIFLFISVRLGCALFAVGFILFIMGGRTRGEKSGYRF